MLDELRECYRILEVEPDASSEEVKRAYRELVKVWHPDRFANDPRLLKKSQEKLKQINLAFERIRTYGTEAHVNVSQPEPSHRYSSDPPPHSEQRRGTYAGEDGSAYGRGTKGEGSFPPSGGTASGGSRTRQIHKFLQIAVTVLIVILTAVYICYFTDWFSKESIQIIPQIRTGRASAIPHQGLPAVSPVSFAFDGKYCLTSVKVVAADDYSTNIYANPLWHLISDSNSVPTKAIVYGLPIKGMKPAIPRAHPGPLQPGVSYIMMIEAGKVKSQTNFHTLEVVPEGFQ